VDFEPAGRRVEIHPGQDLLEAARSAGVDLVSVCGGRGSCGSCRVRLMSGGLNSPTLEEQEVFEPEELEVGYRLACQSVPQTDVKADVPAESLASTQRLQLEGQEVETSGTRVISACDLQIDKAGLDDLRSDTTRVLGALAAAGHSHLRFSPKVL
jgi:ferredoxin